jgi:alpha-1,2-mannosyltransferase
VLDALAFAVLPSVLVAAFTVMVVGDHFAFDFHTFWNAARQVSAGRSPYPSPSSVAAARSATGDYEFFAYPPPFVVALVPLALLPYAVAAALFTAFLLGCVVAALRVLQVEDWRCYGATFLAVPTLSSLRLGEVTPVLLLALALAWRYRDRWPAAGAAVAAAVVLKLFLWPLVGWLLATRRWRAAAAASVGAAAATVLAWSAIGFHGLGDYPALLRNLGRLEAKQSYSLVAAADRLHLPDPQVSWLALALPIVVVLVAMCARTNARSFDARTYSAAVALALVLTPILWLNYFLLLVVPVALASRRSLGTGWAVPAAFWIAPFQEPMRHPLWRLALVTAIVLAAAARVQPSGPRRASARRILDDRRAPSVVEM